MVEFRTEYYTPMERQAHERVELESARAEARLEEPIVPVKRLGQTVPEHDPSGRNILQNVQAAIRAGVGSIQIVMQTPIEQAVGGRPKGYGEEIREAIKEITKANEVLITGFEMPTSLTNLSGLDLQQGRVSEEKRRQALDEVKDMVRFAAEVAEGGGVDIVSWEYPRPVHEAEWFEKDKTAKEAFKQQAKHEEETKIVRFVDERNGQILEAPLGLGVWVPINKNDWKIVPPEQGYDPEKNKWKYEDFENYAKHQLKTKGVAKPTAEQIKKQITDIIREQFMRPQIDIARSEAGFHRRRLEPIKRALEVVKNVRSLEELPEEMRMEYRGKTLKEIQDSLQGHFNSEVAAIRAQERNAREAEERMKSLRPLEQYVLEKSAQTYAEAGLAAWQAQQTNSKSLKRDLYVGPELGWPQFYGSHPKEFRDLILLARKRMAEKLCQEGVSPSVAESEAKKHIKGVFDTSHMGMWLQNFRPDLPWKERLEKFNKWYKEQVEWLAKEHKKHDLIGGVQVVDSQSGAHGHLPPGQGVLPVVDAVKILQEKGGYTGYIVSEGHEEERFGQGRILTKAWQAFNSPISTGYGPAVPAERWRNVQHGYFGKTYSPTFIFGAYAPSNEFKLWSEVPLE